MKKPLTSSSSAGHQHTWILQHSVSSLPLLLCL